MFSLFGCNKVPKYKVDYDKKSMYVNAQDKYAAGKEVELYYPWVATDTDYRFYLDDEEINFQYDDNKGFLIKFTMPDHDVKLRCDSRNSMIYVPPTEPKDTLLIDSYRATVATVGGDGYDEIAVYSYDDENVRLGVYSQYEGESTTETNYLVPREVVDRCLDVIDKYGMREWNTGKDTFGITGAKLVCKFKDGDDYIRVTSEKMPENGKEAFSAVESVLYQYVKDEYRID